jgi:hypothetical protein
MWPAFSRSSRSSTTNLSASRASRKCREDPVLKSRKKIRLKPDFWRIFEPGKKAHLYETENQRGGRKPGSGPYWSPVMWTERIWSSWSRKFLSAWIWFPELERGSVAAWSHGSRTGNINLLCKSENSKKYRKISGTFFYKFERSPAGPEKWVAS